MKNYDPTKNIVYKDKATGKMINKDTLVENKIKELGDNELLEIIDEGDSYIIYLDNNNLYGAAMIQYLPVGEYKWNNDEWTTEKILELKVDAHIGYLFDVNVSHPEELYNYFNQYPP